ncbi:hypothetical protein CCB80_02145 [Armatimonadetes bacterium Uphvl-Ar1]|nr:hypothetical protein CCB80_02145 [Armatimonadetes bacterium Uphvl-Ar1]
MLEPNQIKLRWSAGFASPNCHVISFELGKDLFGKIYCMLDLFVVNCRGMYALITDHSQFGDIGNFFPTENS